MANWHRRMIHYEPVSGTVDVAHGSVAYHGDGVVTVDYGGVSVLANPTLSGGRSLPTRPDAVLVPAVEHVEALVDAPALGPDTPVVTPPGLVATVSEFGFLNVHPLDAWCQIVLRRGDASVTITALPTGRQTAIPDLAMDTMLEFRSNADAIPYRVYLSSGCVSAAGSDEIATRCPRIDLAVISLASMRIEGTVVGFDTDQAVEIVRRLHPGLTIPVHRFDDVFTWPARDFRKSLARAGWNACIQDVPPGNAHVFALPSRVGQTPTIVPRAGVRDEPGLVMTGGF